MHPTPTTPRPARPGAPRNLLGAVAAPCLRLAAGVLILAVLAAVLGPRRLARAWHLAGAALPTHFRGYEFEAPSAARPIRLRSIHDGTHLVCEHPLLYAIGPGPNRGLRPLPRALPLAPAVLARAPPRLAPSRNHPIRAKSPPNRGTRPLGHRPRHA